METVQRNSALLLLMSTELTFVLFHCRFNYSRDSNIGNTTAIDAEARLLDLLQSDFLALLGAFK